jgi:transposase
MEVVVERSCGLDVHQSTVVACVLTGEPGRNPRKVVRTFGAMRRDLEEMRDWLKSLGVTDAVMEGTGVYWMPVYAVLEGHVEPWVVNAHHVKKVPGRKTDVSDAQWLASLLRMGLLRKSFVLAKEIRPIRDLSRYRRMLVQSETAEKNRILKLIEMMGIKLASVVSDVFGKSGMAMLRAIAAGNISVQALTQLARGRLRSKLPELALALDVLVKDHHRVMLRGQLARLDRTTAEIAQYDDYLEQVMEPYSEQLALLCSIDGIQRTAAIEIFAEVGPDLASFPDEAHLASWAGTCPGMNQSAGKRSKARRRRGNPYLQSILVECALAATKKKNSYLKDKYHRLRGRRGSMRALFAIAHKLCRAVYRVLTTGVPYRDLGDQYLDRLHRPRIARALAQRLQALGYDQDSVRELFSQPRALNSCEPAHL